MWCDHEVQMSDEGSSRAASHGPHLHLGLGGRETEGGGEGVRRDMCVQA